MHKLFRKNHTSKKGEIMKGKILVLSCIILLLVTGCSNEKQSTIYHEDDIKQEIESLKQVLKDNKNLSKAAGVFADDQLLVSIQVKPMSKFKKRKIENLIKKEVKSVFPDHKVFVSSDLKISWELRKIIKEKPKMEVLKKELKDIKTLAKEQT